MPDCVGRWLSGGEGDPESSLTRTVLGPTASVGKFVEMCNCLIAIDSNVAPLGRVGLVGTYINQSL